MRGKNASALAAGPLPANLRARTHQSGRICAPNLHQPDQPAAGSTSALLKPTAIGLGATLSPPESGTLFLKINDSAGELDDNAGELKVEVRHTGN